MVSSQSTKRPIASTVGLTDERPGKRQAIEDNGDLFRGMDRESFRMARVHKKLHAQSASLSDAELAQLGNTSFNQQFPMLEEMLNAAQSNHRRDLRSNSLFGPLSRDEYMQARVHRRVHPQAALLTDEELSELGRMSFNQQITAMEKETSDEGHHHVEKWQQASQAPSVANDSDELGGMSREAYMNKHVHRKLHPQASRLPNDQLVQLGQLKFNDQFPHIEHLEAASMFGSLGREGYMQQRVHRKLHAHASTLSNKDLFALGQKKFNDQFGDHDTSISSPHAKVDIFGQVGGREAYMQQRVHKRLHARASLLSDEDVLQLGQLSFNEQFPCIENLEPTDRSSPSVQADIFGGIGRDQYMRTHVHRKLHALAESLSDSELLDLGKLGFNAQFPVFGADAEQSLNKVASSELGAEPFEGMGREAYMQQRVHRKLHSLAEGLTDEGLLELGRLSFNDQFPMLGQDQVAQADVFAGLGREEYIQQRVHRRLHAHVASLSDKDLQEFGSLSFNKQFQKFEQPAPVVVQARTHVSPAATFFNGMSREQFMAQRVHRRLVPKATAMSDQELLELGRLSFNEQFKVFENIDVMAEADGI